MIENPTPFMEYQRIIESCLSLLHKTYEGSMGREGDPANSRLALEPLDVLADMADLLQSAALRIAAKREEFRGGL